MSLSEWVWVALEVCTWNVQCNLHWKGFISEEIGGRKLSTWPKFNYPEKVVSARAKPPQEERNNKRLTWACNNGWRNVLFTMPPSPANNVDKIGYWGKPTSTLDWCEYNYEVNFYIAEFCEYLLLGVNEWGYSDILEMNAVAGGKWWWAVFFSLNWYYQSNSISLLFLMLFHFWSHSKLFNVTICLIEWLVIIDDVGTIHVHNSSFQPPSMTNHYLYTLYI